MTAKANITLTDSSSTGTGATDRIFTPGGMIGNIHTFSNGDTGETGAGKSRLTAQLVRNKGAIPGWKVKYSLILPFEYDDNGVLRVSHELREYREYLIPDTASEDERLDLAALSAKLSTHIGLNDMIWNLEDLS